MSQAIITRYDRINERAEKHIAELLLIEEKGAIVLSYILRDIADQDATFRSKRAEMKLGEYQTFEDWMNLWLQPRIRKKRRQLWHYVHVERNLLHKITDEELNRLGINRAIEVSRLAEVKGKVSKEFIEKALTLSAEEIHEEVRAIIYKGNPSHEDTGGWATLEVRGPRTHTAWLQAFLQLVRRQEGHGPSDAELLHLLLVHQEQELREAEEDRRKKIAGTA